MIRSKRVRTSSKEIFNKLNSLHFCSEAVFDKDESTQIMKILRTLNEDKKFFNSEIIGDKILVKKLMPLSYYVEYKKI